MAQTQLIEECLDGLAMINKSQKFIQLITSINLSSKLNSLHKALVGVNRFSHPMAAVQVYLKASNDQTHLEIYA